MQDITYQFNAEVNFQRVRLNRNVVNQAATQLMAKIDPAVVQGMKQAMVEMNAVRSGRTQRSIRSRKVASRSLSSQGGGILHRQVVGNKALGEIISGRGAGQPMPVRMVGIGKRGGRVFEPLPNMLRWFVETGIPKSQWFPIMRAISRRGIRPKNIPKRAVEIARPNITVHARAAGFQIARGIITRAN